MGLEEVSVRMNRDDLKNINLFLLDLDGTLYVGNRLFDFTKKLLESIKAAGKKYLFMTNNSSKSAADYAKKLRRLGIEAAEEDVVTSSQATAHYLKIYYKGAKLYVCGTYSLKQELREEGFAITEALEEVDCIVVGYDTELTYQKLEDVCRLLNEKELPYIATHPDVVCPTEYGNVPDCGCICDMIFKSTGKQPVVIGKPEALMPEMAMQKLGYQKSETAVVGDRIYTDIKCGLNAGITSILVMSGETTKEILEVCEEKPHIVLQDCGELIPYL